MKFTRLIGFRLFLIVLGVMGIGTAFVTTLTVQWQTNNHMATAVKTAASISDVIKRSTHYSMLLNRREDIYNIITTIGHEPSIDGIRIYTKQGIVSFSTKDEEVGNRVNMDAEACTVCHASGQPPAPPSPQTLSRSFTSPKGYRVLGMITPEVRQLLQGECIVRIILHPNPTRSEERWLLLHKKHSNIIVADAPARLKS